MMDTLAIPGAIEFVHWFGRWPSFHDAEVIGLGMNRAQPSTIKIHCFDMTSVVLPDGTYECTHHAIVCFQFEEVFDSELRGFNHQNVLSGLMVTRDAIDPQQYKLVLGGCYGLEGWLLGARLSMTFVEGRPTEGIYASK
jgi:hypothetical protein